MTLRTQFRFTLPGGRGIAAEAGRRVSGMMRLVRVKDILQIERDAGVRRDSGVFYVVLLGKVITALGNEKAITRKTIERLCPADFAFCVDFLHEINHQVIKRMPLRCALCGHEFLGELGRLGEA